MLEIALDDDELTVWPGPDTDRNRGTTPLPTVLWWGLNHCTDAETPLYSIVRLVSCCVIRTRGTCTVSGDFRPGLSYFEQFSTFDEAYRAASIMIQRERGPHEPVPFYDAIAHVFVDHRRS